MIKFVEMLIGLISDTHDNIYKIEKAVKIFNEKKVEFVLHAGDHIAPFTLNWFKPLKVEMIGVMGNLDAEKELLRRKYAENGWKVYRDAVVLNLDGKIVLTHGVSEVFVKALALSGEFDVVVRGHTHKVQKELIKDTLIINPGEACGYLSGRSSIALLKMPEKKVEIIEI